MKFSRSKKVKVFNNILIKETSYWSFDSCVALDFFLDENWQTLQQRLDYLCESKDSIFKLALKLVVGINSCRQFIKGCPEDFKNTVSTLAIVYCQNKNDCPPLLANLSDEDAVKTILRFAGRCSSGEISIWSHSRGIGILGCLYFLIRAFEDSRSFSALIKFMEFNFSFLRTEMLLNLQKFSTILWT